MELNIWQITGYLAGAVILGALITLVAGQWIGRRGKRETDGTKNGVQWRKNVLMLLGMAYGSLMLIFIVMICWGTTPKEAYDLLGVPFVALIGGTLTIAKDLI